MPKAGVGAPLDLQDERSKGGHQPSSSGALSPPGKGGEECSPTRLTSHDPSGLTVDGRAIKKRRKVAATSMNMNSIDEKPDFALTKREEFKKT